MTSVRGKKHCKRVHESVVSITGEGDKGARKAGNNGGVVNPRGLPLNPRGVRGTIKIQKEGMAGGVCNIQKRQG